MKERKNTRIRLSKSATKPQADGKGYQCYKSHCGYAFFFLKNELNKIFKVEVRLAKLRK